MEGDRCEAGRIRNCRVLTPEEAQRALAVHKEKGWFRQMRDDVEAAGGSKEELDYQWLFNVRFRPEDVVAPYAPPIPFAPVPEKITRSSRYQLMEASDTDLRSLPVDRRRDGKADLPDVLGGTIEKPPRTVSIDPQEKRLQRRLMELLKQKFGKENVRREGGFGPAQFDLVVKHGQRTILIELKAYADARMAIREALGQILEYTFFYPQKTDNTENIDLFIVAPAPMNESVSNYMNLLRTRFTIPVHYCSFTLADLLPRDFVTLSGNPA